MSKTDLEQLVKDARAKGLNQSEIETMKRHYYSGVLDYTSKHEPKPGIDAAIKHVEFSEWCGYAAATGYMRRTIDSFQKGEEK